MKKIILTVVGVTTCVGLIAQTLTPVMIPCSKVSPHLINNYNGVIEGVNCVETVDNLTDPIEVLNSQNVDFKAGDEIIISGEFTANPNNVGHFNALLEKGSLNIAWFDPNSTPGFVKKYEKLELGVNFPQQVNDEISSFFDFVNNSSSPEIAAIDPAKQGLNPFDPEDIDLKAEFSYFIEGFQGGVWSDDPIFNIFYPEIFNEFPKKVYGFYYNDFEPEVDPSKSLVELRWTPLNLLDNYNSDYNFRIRFAPPLVGLWKCKITATVNGTVLKALDFTFNVIENDNPNKHGYMTTSPNKRYFYRDNEIYFPVGRNIPEVDCLPDPVTGQFYGQCDQVPEGPKIRNDIYHKAFRNRLTDYANNGGEYFRMIVFPHSLDIEFEYLNNYYDRLGLAWEMDRLVEHVEDKNLMMHLNLQYTRALEYSSPHLLYNWVGPDDPSVDPNCAKLNDEPYCYSLIPGVNGIADFFTDSEARKRFKYRLRYFASRWGYSTNIAVFELMNEINNTGSEGQNIAGDPNCGSYLTNTLYGDINATGTAAYRENIYHWQDAMAMSLKHDQYFPHLISANYVNFDHKFIDDGDRSYYSYGVDIASSNFYSNTYIDRLQRLSVINNSYRDDLDYILYKPYVNSEIGIGFNECDNKVTLIRELWASTFSGMAMTSMQWAYQHQYDLVHYQTEVQNFINGIDFDGGDDGPWKSQVATRGEDKAASSFTLISNEPKKRGIGIVMNNTVNYYTMSAPADVNSVCRDEVKLAFDENDRDYYKIAKTVDANSGANSNKLKVASLADGPLPVRYDVSYYNVFTNAEITSETQWVSPVDKLKLNYPALAAHTGALSSDNAPFIVGYKIKRHNEPSFIRKNDQPELISEEARLRELYRLAEQENKTEQVLVTDWSTVKKETNAIQVSPNPTFGMVKVTFEGKIDEASIKLVNSSGVLVWQNPMNKSVQEVNLTPFPAGIYYVWIESGGTVFTKKIIRK